MEKVNKKISKRNLAFCFFNWVSLFVGVFLIVVSTQQLICWWKHLGNVNRFEDCVTTSLEVNQKSIAVSGGRTEAITFSTLLLDVSPIERPPIYATGVDGGNAEPLEDTGKVKRSSEEVMQEEKRADKLVDVKPTVGEQMSKSLGPRKSDRNENKVDCGTCLQKLLVFLKKVRECTVLRIVVAACSIGLGVLKVGIFCGPVIWTSYNVTYGNGVTKRCGSYFRFWILARLFGLVTGIGLLVIKVVAGECCNDVVELPNCYPLEVNIAVNVLFILFALYDRNRNSAVTAEDSEGLLTTFLF